ncbi:MULTISPECIES: septal ring lytic transglycosylase RlpA family protein [unclassified Acidovorax]|uniref:septal ring lytic transglycosylase RlpA family protein n=1 Tax=unclassified Acidovorax TaxID=2684926 RepID=UPI001C474851|nr:MULTISPECIES: septal ring lytic transglycosylase RlpA family protein [unclassified Acidovorax]MBV7428415.1 septal ring lytic transglycosylase RlpA family protein [Acidovorax sp. sif0732]MBV7449671.1 septal ring lytic transglycosylase RlpA family protein [Acidovorax sp. sif0715]
MRQPRGDAAVAGPVEGRRAALWWKVLGVVCCGVSVWGCSSWGRAQGLSAEADALAPHLLSVPGEAMLIDPPRPGGREDGTESPQAPQLRLPADEVGLASWYGAKFHKRRTASGEPFDMKALTAAHPTLPFGSRVCVRSQATGRSVVVRINDRGPHTGNRVIDLSRGAAEVLGMVGLGLKPVELFALDEGERDCPAP